MLIHFPARFTHDNQKPSGLNWEYQYAQANDGQFPTDLSQLKPYFESPVDDAILQRYEIVPTKSLVSYLAELGGDWLITEKAPINKELDQRVAINLTRWRITIQQGRWDPVP